MNNSEITIDDLAPIDTAPRDGSLVRIARRRFYGRARDIDRNYPTHGRFIKGKWHQDLPGGGVKVLRCQPSWWVPSETTACKRAA